LLVRLNAGTCGRNSYGSKPKGAFASLIESILQARSRQVD
jgi:hypothetical protein